MHPDRTGGASCGPRSALGAIPLVTRQHLFVSVLVRPTEKQKQPRGAREAANGVNRRPRWAPPLGAAQWPGPRREGLRPGSWDGAGWCAPGRVFPRSTTGPGSRGAGCLHVRLHTGRRPWAEQTGPDPLTVAL